VVSSRRLDRLCGLKRPLEVARVEADQLAAGEPASDALSLAASLVGEWRIELALDPVLPVPRRLSVANEQEPRGRWPGSEW